MTFFDDSTYFTLQEDNACPSLPSPISTLEVDCAHPWKTYHCHSCEVSASQPDPETYVSPLVPASPPSLYHQLSSPSNFPIAICEGILSTYNPHTIYNYVSYIIFLLVNMLSRLPGRLFLFPKIVQEALSHLGWHQAMIEEMHALELNHT